MHRFCLLRWKIRSQYCACLHPQPHQSKPSSNIVIIRHPAFSCRLLFCLPFSNVNCCLRVIPTLDILSDIQYCRILSDIPMSIRNWHILLHSVIPHTKRMNETQRAQLLLDTPWKVKGDTPCTVSLWHAVILTLALSLKNTVGMYPLYASSKTKFTPQASQNLRPKRTPARLQTSGSRNQWSKPVDRQPVDWFIGSGIVLRMCFPVVLFWSPVLSISLAATVEGKTLLTLELRSVTSFSCAD